MPKKEKGDPGTPAKEETPDQFIENRLVKLETGMTDLHSNLTSLEAGVSNMAAQQSMTDTKLDDLIALMTGRQNTAAGGLGDTAPSGGHGSEVQPEVISNLQHQFETPRGNEVLPSVYSGTTYPNERGSLQFCRHCADTSHSHCRPFDLRISTQVERLDGK